MDVWHGIPLPEPSELTDPFWAACRAGTLAVQHCEACARRIFPPLPACPGCLSRKLSWLPSPGRGVIYSFTVVRRAARPDRPVPYIIATIDLDDGWSMTGNVVAAEPDAVRCGAAVAVRFLVASAEIHLPVFALID